MLRLRLGCGLLAATTFLLFTLNSAAQTAQPKFVTLYAFNGSVNSGDGIYPTAPLVAGAGGVLYGVTYQGGTESSPCYLGCGTVFSLTPSHGGSWSETQIDLFTSGSDGFEPGTLAISPSGVLYGTTAGGGSTGCGGTGCGTAFSLTPSAAQTTWTKSTYTLPQATSLPNSLRFSATGVLYGTSSDGGTGGSFFSLKPPTTGQAWTEHLLYSFPADKYHPLMTLTGPGGVVYGTSEGGDPSCPVGCGIVFSLTPPKTGTGSWTETVLDAFVNQGNHPYGNASIVLGSDGVIYGTTRQGGQFNLGAVFSLTPPSVSGGSWTETLLYSFAGPPDAATPNQGLVMAKDGTLYGTSFYGGDANCQTLKVGCGAVFSLTPPSSSGGAWTETVLHAFTGGTDGGNPIAGLTIGANGVLYGTTTAWGGTGKYGTVFAVTP